MPTESEPTTLKTVSDVLAPPATSAAGDWPAWHDIGRAFVAAGIKSGAFLGVALVLQSTLADASGKISPSVYAVLAGAISLSVTLLRQYSTGPTNPQHPN